MKRFHLVAGLGWTAMIPVSIATSLKHSLPYLVGISVYALAAAHLAAWAGERAKTAAEDDGTEGM